MKRSPFEPDHVRATDTARDLDVPPISAQARAVKPHATLGPPRFCAARGCPRFARKNLTLCGPCFHKLEQLSKMPARQLAPRLRPATEERSSGTRLTA